MAERRLQLLLLAAVLGIAAAAPVSGAGKPVVARVYFPDRRTLDELAAELDIWEVHQAQGFLVAMLTPEQRLRLSGAGFQIEEIAEQTSRLNTPLAALPQQTAGVPGFPCYRTVEETYADLSRLATVNPGFASLTNIGVSWDKAQAGGPAGYDLWALVLSNKARPEPKFKFFLIAEVHARELVTAELATRTAEYLVAHYGTDPDVTWLLDYGEAHIVALGNPDGRKWAEQGYLWRKNTDNNDGCATFPDYGTDLNRNCNFKWGYPGSSANACDYTYRGPAAGSEPETLAMQNYVASLFPDQRGPNDSDPAPSDATGVFVTLHSYSNLVLFPWGWTNSPAPNATALQTLGRKFGYFNGYEVHTGYDLYAASGTGDDWTYGRLGVAAYTFEMGNAFFQDCATFTNIILRSNLPALLYAFKAARQPYRAPVAPESVSVAVSPATVAEGGTVRLSAVADGTRYNSGGHGIEPTHAITAARFSLDAPSWSPGTVVYPMTFTGSNTNPAVRAVEAYIDTTGLLPGRHTLFVESQNTTSNWGVPTAVFLQVGPPPLAIELTSVGCVVLRWPTVTGTFYDVQRSTNLLALPDAGFTLLTNGVPPGLYGAQAFTNCPGIPPPVFYRLRAYSP